MKTESKKMPEYEIPVAVPLGEAAKGSGQCNAGSGVTAMAGDASGCVSGTGGTPPHCWSGSDAYTCIAGSTTSFMCSGGSLPNQDV